MVKKKRVKKVKPSVAKVAALKSQLEAANKELNDFRLNQRVYDAARRTLVVAFGGDSTDTWGNKKECDLTLTHLVAKAIMGKGVSSVGPTVDYGPLADIVSRHTGLWPPPPSGMSPQWVPGMPCQTCGKC